MKHFDITKAPPRLASEGFVPAGPVGRVNSRAMLIPKPRRRDEFVPGLTEDSLSLLAGKLGPQDRRALREITETGDLVTEGRHTYLIARVSSETILALASFESEGADREPYMDDEPSLGGDSYPVDAERDMTDDEPNGDDEPDRDNEPDYRTPDHRC